MGFPPSETEIFMTSRVYFEQMFNTTSYSDLMQQIVLKR